MVRMKVNRIGLFTEVLQERVKLFSEHANLLLRHLLFTQRFAIHPPAGHPGTAILIILTTIDDFPERYVVQRLQFGESLIKNSRRPEPAGGIRRQP